jgi:quinol monooxygenase YgiN
MILIYAIIDIKESAGDVVEECVAHAKAGLGEPGCFEYVFAVDPETPRRLHCFERWESDGAIQAHMSTPRSVQFAAWMNERAARVQVSRYQVVDDQSDDFRRQSATLMGDSVQT